MIIDDQNENVFNLWLGYHVHGAFIKRSVLWEPCTGPPVNCILGAANQKQGNLFFVDE